MGRDREMPAVVKLGLGAGIGYALYRILGGGHGAHGAHGADEGRAPRPSLPARAPDAAPVEIRVQPLPADPTRTIIEMEGRPVSFGELVARIDAGGRRDVIVTVRGDARQAGWEEIRAALQFSGIEILERQQKPNS